jgi:hypothetical protein
MKLIKLIIMMGISISTAFAQITQIDLTHQAQGTLSVSHGGTGATTSNNALINLFANASNCSTSGYVYSPSSNSCIANSGGSGGGSSAFIFPASWNQVIPSNTYLSSFVIPVYATAPLVITIPSGCTGSVMQALVAATNSTSFTLVKNGTSTLCTGLVASSGTTATWSGSGGTATSNDRLDIIGGGDSTLSGVAISIAGTKSGGQF